MSAHRRGLTNWFISGLLLGMLGLSLFFHVVLNERLLVPAVPEPYDHVVLKSVEWVDDDILVVANFNKNDECVFDALRIFVLTDDGIWQDLRWEDRRPETDIQGEGNEDRLGGEQTIYLAMLEAGVHRDNLERIEMRTRHLCYHINDFVKNDKVFAVILPDQVKG